MGHQLSITVDHQGTSSGHLDVTSILELADREIRVIGLIEYRRSLDIQQHVAGLEFDTFLTKDSSAGLRTSVSSSEEMN